MNINGTLLKYFLDGSSIWDTNTYEYPDFMDADVRGNVERILQTAYPLRKIQTRVLTLSEALVMGNNYIIPMLVYALCIENSYKWKTLLATENFEYNPIENYDRKENEETESLKGSQTNSSQYGATSETRTQTAHTNTNTAGAHTDTLADAAHTDTTTDTVSSENSVTYQPNEQTETAYGAASTTNSYGAQTNTTEYGATSETAAGQAHTDSFSEGARTDTFERESYIHGNIGVTSTQQMIEQERNIANFSALHEIAHDIVLEITKGVM